MKAQEKKFIVTMPAEMPPQLEKVFSKEFKELVGLTLEFTVKGAAKEKKAPKK